MKCSPQELTNAMYSLVRSVKLRSSDVVVVVDDRGINRCDDVDGALYVLVVALLTIDDAPSRDGSAVRCLCVVFIATSVNTV